MKRMHRILCGAAWLAASMGAQAESVGIILQAPTAKTVFVSGSFDGYWQKRYPMRRDARGRWTAVLELPPGRYEYQFYVDGKWRYDPAQPSAEDSFGARNNVLIVLPR